jgi:integrase
VGTLPEGGEVSDESGRDKKSKPRRSGQIIPRGEKKWLVRIFLGRDANGKRHYHNHKVRGTKTDAQTWLNGALRRLDLGEPIEQTTELCSGFFERWLESAVKQRIRTRSYDLYKQRVHSYILPEIGKKRLAEVRPEDIQNFYAKLQKHGLRASTIRHIRGILSNAFKQAVRWQLLRQNPVAMTDPPMMTRSEMAALDRDQARLFLQAAEGERYYPVYALMLATGCRPGEVFGLKWSDIDWQAGTVTIRRALYWLRQGRGWEITEPKTDRSKRTIPLSVSVVKTLQAWKRSQAEDRLRAGSEWKNLDLVFTKLVGVPLDLETIRDPFKAILKRAGLPTSIRIYDLRHSCATILMAEGENPKVVSERLGHSSVKTTLDLYSHVSPGMQNEASKKLEKAIFE